jgi:hypothetical protein
MGWKVAVISFTLWNIPNRFEIAVKFGHPDNAGGLLPIGLMPFLNIIILCNIKHWIILIG